MGDDELEDHARSTICKSKICSLKSLTSKTSRMSWAHPEMQVVAKYFESFKYTDPLDMGPHTRLDSDGEVIESDR